MSIFTDIYGFESDDIDAVTAELERVLGMKNEPHFHDELGDYSTFEDTTGPGGSLELYLNQTADGDGPYLHEEAYPEIGLILLIEQEGEYFDHAPALKGMKSFAPVLLQKSERLDTAEQTEVLFDLSKERAKRGSG